MHPTNYLLNALPSARHNLVEKMSWNKILHYYLLTIFQMLKGAIPGEKRTGGNPQNQGTLRLNAERWIRMRGKWMFQGGGSFEGQEWKDNGMAPAQRGTGEWTGEQEVRLQGARLDLEDFMGRVRVYFILNAMNKKSTPCLVNPRRRFFWNWKAENWPKCKRTVLSTRCILFLRMGGT